MNEKFSGQNNGDSINMDEMSEKIARYQHLKIIFGASMYFMLILLVFVFFSRQKLKLTNKKLEQKQIKLEASFQRLKEQEEEIRHSHSIVTQKREQLELALKSTRSITWEYNILSEQFSIDAQDLAVLGDMGKSDFTSPNQLMDLIHPDDREIFLTEFAQYLQGESDQFMIEQRLIMKDGSARWFLSRGEMVKENNDENSTRMVGLMWDISDRKNWEKTVTSGHEQLLVAKEELRIAHLELKSAFDDLKFNRDKVEFALKSAGVGSWEFDIKRNLIKVDEFGKKLLPFEIEKNSFKFENFTKNISPSHYRELVLALELHKKKVDSSISLEFPFKYENSITRWVRIKGNILKWNDNGEPVLLVGTLQDVNEGRRIISFLQDQKAMNEAVLENVQGQVVYFDRALKLLWANQAYRNGFGKGHESLPILFSKTGQNNEFPVIEAMRENKKVYRTLKIAENQRLFSLAAIPVIEMDGEVKGCVMSIHEVSEVLRN